jgi:hypothetical protein
VSEIFAELLGRRFPAFSNLPAVDDHIVLVRAAVDPEGTEGEIVKVHNYVLQDFQLHSTAIKGFSHPGPIPG